MKITLSIPTYNTSLYFWDSIKNAIKSDLIGEIIINDDGSDIRNISNYYEMISKIDNKKIKFFKNDSNHKAFKNKYITVSKSSYDWIYLLDSDNYFDSEVLDLFENIDYDPKVCYCPQTLLLTNGESVNYKEFDEYVDIHISKKYIYEGKKNFDWFLNTGNFLVNKNEYLKTQEYFFNNPKFHATADVIVFTYYWLISGNKFKIIDNFEYHHRIRPGNYYMDNPIENLKILTEYGEKILQF